MLSWRIGDFELDREQIPQLSNTPNPKSLLEAEKENQIAARALRTAKQRLLDVRSLHDVGLQTEPVGQVVFEDEVRAGLVADALLYADVEVLPHLLTERDLGTAAVLRRQV